MNATLKLIRKATEVLKRDGWIKGKLHKNAYAANIMERGSHCMIGAIQQAYDELNASDPTTYPTTSWGGRGGASFDEALKLVAGQIEPNSPNVEYDPQAVIAGFNDSEKTVFDQVRSVFTNTLRKLKEGSI